MMKFFESDNISFETAKEINNFYLDHSSDYIVLMEEKVRDVLADLSERYDLYILSKSKIEHAKRKVDSAEIAPYFKKVLSSTDLGYMKPTQECFNYAYEEIGTNDTSKMLIIGDSIYTDIQGANIQGIDSVLYNPNNLMIEHNATYEINRMDELLDIL